jgi:hypothetical protein
MQLFTLQKKGAVMSMVKNEDFKIIKGEDKLKLYQFHTKVPSIIFAQYAESTLIIILDQIQK